MNQNHFLVVGDDKRQKYLAEELRQKGHLVAQANEILQGDFEALLLPLSKTAKYVREFHDKFASGQLVFGCNFPEEIVDICDETGVHFVDYMKVAGVACKNAVVTAEATMVEAIRQGECALYGSRCLVAGYGRCGEVLAQRLVLMGAKVTVLDRNVEKRSKAQGVVPAVYSFENVPDAILTRQCRRRLLQNG